MQLKEIMTSLVECVKPTDTLVHTAERMRDMNVGSLPVCDSNDRLAGMITDRDITIRATADSCEPEMTLVADVMTPEVTWCFEDQEIDEAARIMEEKQIRRLIILNHDKRMVGIVSLGDLAVKADDKHLCGEALEHISEPAAPIA